MISNPGGSTLWVKNTSGFIPTVNVGPIGAYYGAPSTNYLKTTATGSNYDCAANYLNKSLHIPVSGEYYDESQFHAAELSFYKFLFLNDSLRAAEPDLNSYYSGFTGSNYESFMQVEEYLKQKAHSNAKSKLSSITEQNDMERNYVTFYSIYANFLESVADSGSLSSADSLLLVALANACPNIDGASVYQARALYTAIYRDTYNYIDCSESGSKAQNINLVSKDEKSTNIESSKYWLMPNPSNGSFKIGGFLKDGASAILIENTVKQEVYNDVLLVKDKTLEVDIVLPNGVYFVSVSFQNENKRILKLLVNH
jgi:hypothetical protein